MTAIDTMLCDAVRDAARGAGMSGKVRAQVVFRNPSAVEDDLHTVRMSASVGKTWRVLQFYPVTIGFDLEATIARFANEFVEFYRSAMAA